MKVKELGHVVLYVKNLHDSIHFYRDILGFDMLGEDGTGYAAFSSGRTHHELLLIEVGTDVPNPPKGRRAGLYHIGFKVGESVEELRAAKAELEAAGVIIDHLSDHTVTYSIYLYDPDGNEIEIYIDLQPEIWRSDPNAIMTPRKDLVI